MNFYKAGITARFMAVFVVLSMVSGLFPGLSVISAPVAHAATSVSFTLYAVPNPTGTDTDMEYVTIHNGSSQDVDLTGWYLEDNNGDTLALSGTIGDGADKLACANDDFSQNGGKNCDFEFPSGFALVNSNGSVSLVAPDDSTIVVVTWMDATSESDVALSNSGSLSDVLGTRGGDKIDLCHATASDENPYNFNSVSVNSFFGPQGHSEDTDDIIPPFFYDNGNGVEYFAGNNWDDDGQALHKDDCGDDDDEEDYGSVKGLKWNDLNGNGSRDDGEPTMRDWEITIMDDDDFSESTTTNADGEFWFTDLIPGSYLVCEEDREGWYQTYPATNDECHSVLVEEEDDVEDVDFGNREKEVVEPSVCKIGDNLLSNPSFEDPSIDSSWKLGSITDWVVTKVSDNAPVDGELWRGLFGGASHGEQNVEMDSTEPTKLTQTVTTIPGATYELRFDFSPRPKTGLADNDVDALIDGGVLMNASGDGSGISENDWSTHSETFVATGASTDVAFADKGTANGLGSLIDNAVLCLVEEPAPKCEVTLVSDETDYVVEKDANAQALTFIHSAWKAVIDGATWIWGDDPVVDPSVEETQTFVKQFGFEGTVLSATLEVASDNTHSAMLNGNASHDGGSTFASAVSYDVTSEVQQGNNELKIAVTNLAQGSDPRANPAGLLYKLHIEGEVTDAEDCSIPYVPEPEYAPYCGDGEVNQEWEQCDGGVECTAQCQFDERLQCTDLTLAKIDMTEVSNTGTGDMTDDIFLGTSTLPIPNDVWFRVYQDGVYDNDENMNNAGYEDVPGLAVERQDGALRVRMHGSATGNDVEHVEGTVEFWSFEDEVSATAVSSDNSQNNKLENEEPGEGSKGNAGNDEVWLDGDDAYFWLTTTTADDGFYVDYSDPVDCTECLVEGYKYDEQGAPLAGWEIGLARQFMFYGDQDAVEWSEPTGMGRDITDETGFYCIEEPEKDDDQDGPPRRTLERPDRHVVYEVMKDGWENLKVMIDGEEASTQTDSFFDIFVEVELGEDERVDFYNQEIVLACESHVDLITNGSFEEPVVDNDAGWNIFSSVTGWVIEWADSFAGAPEDPQLELQRNVADWDASEGDQYAELDTDWEGPGGDGGDEASVMISQTIDTIPGEYYTLSWDFSPRPGTTDADNELDVYVDGEEVDSNGGAGGDDVDWTSHEHVFKAEGDETTISFADDGRPNSVGTFLDNVALMCNPEYSAPYCGDGEVNQEWEQCDDEEGCAEYCLFENQCHDEQLVKITLDSEAPASKSFDGSIHLGEAGNTIPSGTWFKFNESGDDSVNAIAVDGGDRIEGLAVERRANDLRLAVLGDNASKQFDYVFGTIEVLGLDMGDTDRKTIAPWKLENSGKYKDIFKVENNELAFKWYLTTGNDAAAVELTFNEEEYGQCGGGNGGDDDDLYRIQGYVWHDDDEDSEWDENDIETGLGGYLVKAVSGETEYSTTTDEDGMYYFDVPAGTWTISWLNESGWQQIYPESNHVVTVPAEVTFGQKIFDLLIPTAHAQFVSGVLGVYGDYNFGINETSGSNGGGGGGSGPSVTLSSSNPGPAGSVAGASDSDDGPEPMVLGEQVSAVPFGAPNAGAGGTDSKVPLVPFIAAMLLAAATVRVVRYVR